MQNFTSIRGILLVKYLCVDFLNVFLATTLQILAPLPIGFAVFLVHLATIPITGTGINPARSLGAAIIYNKDHARKCFSLDVDLHEGFCLS